MTLRRMTLGCAIALGAIALAEASCKSNDVTQNNDDQYESFARQQVDSSQDTDVVGPDGAKVHIPAHALAETTTITIGKMKAGTYPLLPAGWATTGGVYSFEPHAQTFALAVTITVPFVDDGQPIRLVTAEPNGGWSPVDGVTLKGGFVTFDSPHFSFYTVVTGAPPEVTPHDGGSDATIPDAAPDVLAEAEAGPPPPPTTMFVTTQATQALLRFFPIEPGADAGLDAAANDGGMVSLFTTHPSALALGGTPPMLFIGEPTGGDGGATQSFADPFGALVVDASIATHSPGPMTFGNGALWVANQGANTIEAWSGTTRVLSNPSPFAVGGMAFDAASSTLFVLSPMPPQIVRYTVGGSALAPTLTLVGDAGSGMISGNIGHAIALTPWNELLVFVDNFAQRLDLQLNSKGTYTAAQMPTYMGVSGAGAVHWASSGVDEVFVADFSNSVKRFVFAPGDTAHATPIANGAIPMPPNDNAGSLLVGP